MNIKTLIEKYDITNITVGYRYPAISRLIPCCKKVSALYPEYKELTVWNSLLPDGFSGDLSKASFIMYQDGNGNKIHSNESPEITYKYLCHNEHLLHRFTLRPPDYLAEIARMLAKGSYSDGYNEFGLTVKKVPDLYSILNWIPRTQNRFMLLFTVTGDLTYKIPLYGSIPHIPDNYDALVVAVAEARALSYYWSYMLALFKDDYDFGAMRDHLAVWFPGMPTFSDRTADVENDPVKSLAKERSL